MAFHIWLGIPESDITGNLTLKNYIYHENPPGVVDDRPHKQDVLCHIGIFGLGDPSARNRPAIVQSVRAFFKTWNWKNTGHSGREGDATIGAGAVDGGVGGLPSLTF